MGIHTPYTDAELAELLTDEDRTAAVEDRKLQAVRVVADISLIIDQLEVSPAAVAQPCLTQPQPMHVVMLLACVRGKAHGTGP